MIACDRVLPGRRQPCRKVMTESVDRLGRVHYRCRHCDWQRAGRCWACGDRRSTSNKGLYCDACREEARRLAWRRHERSLNAKRAAKARDRQRNKSEHRKAWRKAWVQANPDKIKAYKRKEGLNPTPRKRERERWWNSQPERIEKKREWARRRYYELHPERPQPVCRTCHASIPWTPPGRPPVRCDACVPAAVRNRRKRDIGTPRHTQPSEQAA